MLPSHNPAIKPHKWQTIPVWSTEPGESDVQEIYSVCFGLSIVLILPSGSAGILTRQFFLDKIRNHPEKGRYIKNDMRLEGSSKAEHNSLLTT